MWKQPITHVLTLTALALMLSGCGGGDDTRPRGDVIIEPSQPEAAAPQTAEQPAAAPAAESTAAAKPAESAVATPPAEMKKEEPAPSTEVASAKPAAETKPAETPKEKPAAEANADKSNAEKGTTFKGRVVVKGDVPTVPPIKPSGNDAFCIGLGEIPNDTVVVGEDNGLADVFVWVRKVPNGVEVPPPPTEPVVLDQKGCRFVPHAVIVEVGQPLLLKNDDPTLHNTKMGGFKNSFNTAVTPNNRDGEEVKIVGTEAIPIPVECNIHTWMSARVLATDNPWHALTDKDGNFEINHLPAGTELEFRIQHGKAGYIEKSLKLTLKDGEVKEQTFEVDASKLAD